TWTDSEARNTIGMPLKLARGSTAEPAELWVLRYRPDVQLHALLQNSDDGFIASLQIAALENEADHVLVLRARPTKNGLAMLFLQAKRNQSYHTQPNLFLPCGRRLPRALRRDAVRELLASDSERITWLHPRPDGSFIPQSLPASAFVPLSERLDYLQVNKSVSLHPWVQTQAFEFESFETREEERTESWRAPFRAAAAEVPLPREQQGTLRRFRHW